MPVIEIKNEKLTVGIDTFGAELKYVNGYGGTKFMWPGEVGVWKSTAPILFPFCGFFKDDTYEFRGKEYHLKGNGFANIKEFEVNLISDTKAEFLLLPDEETVNGYPFDFAFKVVFELVGNRLKTDYVITNNGNDIMPFGVGGHEGYYCPEGIENPGYASSRCLYIRDFLVMQNIGGICFGANLINITVYLLQIQIGVCRGVTLKSIEVTFYNHAVLFKEISIISVSLSDRLRLRHSDVGEG